MENTLFDLCNNNLIGEIPTGIGSMTTLRWLNLSGNQLEGSIPTSLSNISTLEVLDLAKNNLSEQIPQALSNLHWLRVLDVSSNNLCGPIPTRTQFTTFDVASFQSNKCLWGCHIDRCSNQKEKENPLTKGNSTTNNNHVKVEWLSHVDENMSLIALEMRMGIGFEGVVAIFTV